MAASDKDQTIPEAFDYFNRKQAAAYCCVSLSQFLKHQYTYGIRPFTFMGKVVYRKEDLRRAMEREANKQWRR